METMQAVQFVAEAAAVGVWTMGGYILISATPTDDNGWRAKRFVTRCVGLAVTLSWLAWVTP